MSNTNYILTSDGSFISDDEVYHYGIKGMRWGVRKDVRSRSSAYDSKSKRWTREPEGGSLKKQAAVWDAEARMKLARGRSERKIAKTSLKSAKKDLKTGYKEYRAFEKDMAKQYGKTKIMSLIQTKNNLLINELDKQSKSLNMMVLRIMKHINRPNIYKSLMELLQRLLH